MSNNIEVSYVSLKTAKLLKDRGFDLETRMTFDDYNEKPFVFDNGRISHRNSLHCYLSAPDLWTAAQWIEKNLFLWIFVSITIDGRWYFEIYDLKEKRNSQVEVKEQYFSSSNEAFDAGLSEALSLQEKKVEQIKTFSGSYPL